MPGAAGPAYRCEFQLCTLLKGGIFMLGRDGQKTVKQKEQFTLPVVGSCLPLLSFAALFISLINVGSLCLVQCFFFPFFILEQIYEIVFLV